MPGNWLPPEATPESIAFQVDYGLGGGETMHRELQSLGIDPASSRILEIGPGIAFGSMAFLRAAGARVAVTDRWLAPWSQSFHGPVYSTIADKLEGREGFDVAPLRRMVAASAYDASTIECIQDAAEDLSSIPDGTFDAVISNAVLEHIERPAVAFKELYRVTREGGAGLHQVDFRDHRDFNRPLEHLLLSVEEFMTPNRVYSFEWGSQLRQPDYVALLTAAGFSMERYGSNDRASEDYLDDLLARAAAQGKDAATLPREVLADLGGFFWLKKTQDIPALQS
jgi:SAM-dependent methyltransferase